MRLCHPSRAVGYRGSRPAGGLYQTQLAQQQPKLEDDHECEGTDDDSFSRARRRRRCRALHDRVRQGAAARAAGARQGDASGVILADALRVCLSLRPQCVDFQGRAMAVVAHADVLKRTKNGFISLSDL